MKKKLNHIYVLLFLQQLITQNVNSVKYCSQQIANSCQKCNDGYELVQDIDNTEQSNSDLICRATCPQQSLRQNTGIGIEFSCNSLCSLSQIGNFTTKSCEEIYKCPQSFEFGNSFHTGKVDYLILYSNDSNEEVDEIITSSSSDERIFVWDGQTGEQRAQFKGHSMNVLKIFLMDIEKDGLVQLFSFAKDGEVIIWNYLKATINYRTQIISGQLQNNSKVDFLNSLIISFGFQGEFFVVNYITLQSIKYIGHTNIVDQVDFFGNNYLISASKDKQILLWEIVWNDKQQSKYLQIFQIQSTKLFVIPFGIVVKIDKNNFDNIFLFSIGRDIITDKNCLKVSKLTDPKINNFLLIFNNNLQTFSDHLNDIIDLIIDNINSIIITYSKNEIIIYAYNNQSIQQQFSLVQKINLSTLLPISNVNIIMCQLFADKFIISTDFGQLVFYEYKVQLNTNNNSFLAPEKNNQIQIEREKGLNSYIQFTYSYKDRIVYVFTNQIIAIDYSTRNIRFIINNWPNPIISHTDKVIKIAISIDNSLLASISDDCRAYIYDIITLELLSVLEYPKNKNIQKGQQIFKPTSISFVGNQNVCISYLDKSVVCYDPLTAFINFQDQNDFEVLRQVEQDAARNFVLGYGNSYIILYDLTLKAIYSQLFLEDQFFVVRFQAIKNNLYTGTSKGFIIKFNYPDLTLQYSKDLSPQNTNNQTLKDIAIDITQTMCLAHFDNGSISIFYKNLTSFKQFQSQYPTSLCGILYPYFAICSTANGKVITWGLFDNSLTEQKYLEYPFIKSVFSVQSQQVFAQSDFGAYGSSITNLDMVNHIPQSTIFTDNKITDFILDEDRQNLYVGQNSGYLSQYHYVTQFYSFVSWQKQGQNLEINKVMIYQEEYKYIILSQAVTIYDYLNLKIYKVIQLHNKVVTGVVIDKLRQVIISFNEDSSNNLFVWYYELDKQSELIGHTNAIKGAEFIDPEKGILITYSSDGNIIVWNYQDQNKPQINKLNLHEKQPILDLFVKSVYLGNIERKLIISRGGNNKIIVYDYNQNEAISEIIMSSRYAQLSIDMSYQRIYIMYENSIHVYSYINGVKIIELIGFDGQTRNIIFEDNYLIAHANQTISCFDRQSLKLLNSEKTIYQIIQISLIRDLIGILIEILHVVKIWNYKTGIMLQDLQLDLNQSFNGIISDKDANLFILRDVINIVYVFNPYAQTIIKQQDKLDNSNFSSFEIKEILIDKQSNILIAYNKKDILQWKYYTQLGKRGFERTLPSNSKINMVYNNHNGKIYKIHLRMIQNKINRILIAQFYLQIIKYINFFLNVFKDLLFKVLKYFSQIFFYTNIDQILYADYEKNLWSIQNNSLNYVKNLDSYPLQSIIVGNILVIRYQTTVKSYNQNFAEISVLKVDSYKLISNLQENSFFFIVNMQQEVIKIQVDQDKFSMEQKQKYQFQDGVQGSSITRIQISLVNTEYKHLILTSQNGQILIVNYEIDYKIATISIHTKRVRQIKYDLSKNLQIFFKYILILYKIKKLIYRLFSCSKDGSVGIHIYMKDLVKTQPLMQIGGQIEDYLVDLKYSRFLIWMNSQTKILIYNTDNMQLVGAMLSPSDFNVKFKISETFDKYAIYNTFQINIFERVNLTFISSIRSRSDLQDIVDIKFISKIYIFIISVTSLKIYKFSLDQIPQLIRSFSMTGSQIFSINLDSSINQINLKGVNYQFAFNYTFTLFEQVSENSKINQQDNLYCYTNIYNPKNYITTKSSLEQQENSIKKFDFDTIIKTVKYNFIYNTNTLNSQPISLYFPKLNTLSNAVSSKYKNLVVYEIQQNVKQDIQYPILINFQNVHLEYELESLNLNKFSFSFDEKISDSDISAQTFHQNTKYFVFTNGTIQTSINKPTLTKGFLFQNITSIIIESLVVKNTYFDGSYTQTQKRKLQYDDSLIHSLFKIQTAKYVNIKQITIENCIFKNLNFFKLQNIENIVIDNILIQNITFNTDNNNMSIFQIINSKNITISNVNISNIQNTTRFNTFSMYGNIQTNISYINLNHVVNSQLLFYTQSFKENKYLYIVQEDQLNIKSLQIDDIKVNSISQLDITCNSVYFENIYATNVLCQNCNGAVIKVITNSFILKNSIFIRNKSFQGGAIYLERCWNECKIINSTIKENNAINGGGLFLKNSELLLQQSFIINNEAYIGGGVRYSDFIPHSFKENYLEKNNNTIHNNKAIIFGKNIASYPRNISLYLNNQESIMQNIQNKTSDQFSKSYFISNFMSGDNFLLTVQLIDEEGEIVKINTSSFSEYPNLIQDELNSYQIQCETDNNNIQLNQETLVSIKQYNDSISSFQFQQLVIISKPLSENHFYIKTNLIQVPSQTNSSQFIQLKYSAYLNISFRKCEIGELFIQKSAGQLEYCKKCALGTYSLKDPMNGEDMSCQICPQEANLCQENQIELKNGYWRKDNNTDLIVECLNAPDNCESESQQSLFYCKKGYIGPLCEVCDINGEVWNSKFSKLRYYECVECKTAQTYYLQMLRILFSVTYIIYCIRQSIKASSLRVIGYYMRMMMLASIGTSDCLDYTSVLLKFLMHYLYIVSIVKKLNFQLPQLFEFVQIQVSTPIDLTKNSFDCYKNSLNIILKPVFFRQIVSQATPIVYFFFISIFYMTLIELKKLKHSPNLIINGLVFFFIYFQPNLLSGIISVSSCRYIANQKYITDDISNECFTDDHIIFLLSFCLPFFIIWGIVLPFIFFFSIYKNRNNLNQTKPRIRYGFLYQEYKLKVFYWEFLKIMLKIMVTLTDKFFNSDQFQKQAICVLFIISYLLLSIRLKPYISNTFNKCDQLSHIALIFIIQFDLIANISSFPWIRYAGKLFLYILHYFMVFYFILKILILKLRSFFMIIAVKFSWFRNKQSFLLKFLNITFENKIQVYKNWKKVYKFIHTKHFTQMRDFTQSCFQNLASQEVRNRQLSQTQPQLQVRQLQMTPRTSIYQSLFNKFSKINVHNSQRYSMVDDIKKNEILLSPTSQIQSTERENIKSKFLSKIININLYQQDMLFRDNMSFDQEIGEESIHDILNIGQQSSNDNNLNSYNFQDNIIKKNNFSQI